MVAENQLLSASVPEGFGMVKLAPVIYIGGVEFVPPPDDSHTKMGTGGAFSKVMVSEFRLAWRHGALLNWMEGDSVKVT